MRRPHSNLQFVFERDNFSAPRLDPCQMILTLARFQVSDLIEEFKVLQMKEKPFQFRSQERVRCFPLEQFDRVSSKVVSIDFSVERYVDFSANETLSAGLASSPIALRSRREDKE
ncbi:hypothetical protein RRG08_039000 [Elysia crispata]|uniref:Uncharacterized protein n=1 Tax=Elysia crispata TaxID=231223 RepID=A0AAE1CTJ1_9GAST|nr:hypothetical protein RRG08_039000 [Elysia crispata]